MRVLVTGASGFTGRYLTPLLRDRGDEVHALSADLTDATTVRAEIAVVRPEAVAHLAARSFVAGDPSTFYAVNQLGTFTLLDALAEAVPGIPVLLASSAQVYGVGGSGLLDETAATRPQPLWHQQAGDGAERGALGRSAAAVDRAAVQLHGRRPACGIPAAQDRRALRTSRTGDRAGQCRGRTRHRRCPRGGGRLCSAVDTRARAGDAQHWHRPPLVDREVLGMLTRLTGHAIEVRVDPTLLRAGDPARLGGDIGRLRARLPDWRPIALEDTLRWMLDTAQV